MSDEAPSAALPPLRRNRDFNLLWVGQVCSELGTATATLAVPLLVLALTGSAVQAGAVRTASAIVGFALRLPAGALVDRWNRRLVMITVDVVRLAGWALLAALVLGHRVNLPVIVVIVCVNAAADVLFDPAESAAIAQIVPVHQRSIAFARNEARAYGTGLAGPPLGGLLYGLARAFPFVANAVSYAISVVTVWTIRTPLRAPRSDRPRQHLLHDMRDGLRHVRGDPFLRAVLIVAAPVNFASNGSFFVAITVLRLSGHSAAEVGIASGVLSIGGFAGAIAAGRIQRWQPSVRSLALLVMSAFVVGLLVASGVTTHLIVVVPLALPLILSPAVNAALFGRLSTRTPDHLQGRVSSVVVMFAMAAAALAPIICGALVEVVDGAAAMGLCAAVAAGATVAAMLSRGLRTEAD